MHPPIRTLVLLLPCLSLINGGVVQPVIAVDVLPELDMMTVQRILESEAMAECLQGTLNVREHGRMTDSEDADPQMSQQLNLRDRMTRCMKDISEGALVFPAAHVVDLSDPSPVRARNVHQSMESAESVESLEADGRGDSAEDDPDADEPKGDAESAEPADRSGQDDLDEDRDDYPDRLIPLPGKRVSNNKYQNSEAEPQLDHSDDAVVVSVSQPAKRVAQPAAETAAEPIADSVVEPADEPAAEPVDEPAAKQEAEPVAEPAAKQEAEPVAEPAAKQEAEPVAEPAAKPMAEPAAEPAANPMAEPVAEPAVKPPAEPVAKVKSDPAGEPEPETRVAATEAAAEPVDDLPSSEAISDDTVIVEAARTVKDSQLSVKQAERQFSTCPTINFCVIGKLYAAVQGAIARQCKGCAAYVQCLGSQQATSMCRNDPVDGAFDDDGSAESNEDFDGSHEKTEKAVVARQGLPVDAISESVKKVTRSADWQHYLKSVIGIGVNHEANRHGRLGLNCYALYGMLRGCLMPSLCTGYFNV